MRKLLYFIPLLASGLLATQDVRVVGTVRVKASPDTPVSVQMGDSASLDSFSRLRVSNPTILFEQTNVGAFSNGMDRSTSTNATITYISTASRVDLNTSTDSGSRAIYQSHGYIMYQPGRSQLALLTGVFGSTQTNNVQRVGLFDDHNGFFFENKPAGMYVVVRSSVGTSVVDTAVIQSSWNLDQLDGTGPSQITADWTKAHIWIIDFQWLGVGRVRFGVDIDGQIIYVHEVLHANSVTNVYMASANLPIRYENVNTGASTATTLRAICSAVITEGGTDEPSGVNYSTSTAIATVNAATTGTMMLAIRPRTGVRTFIVPLDAEILAGASVYYEIVYNGTLSGGTWAQVGDSGVEVSRTATYTAGSGRVINAGYVTSGTGVSRSLSSHAFEPVRTRFANDIAGTTADTIAIVVYSFTGTPAISGAITFSERR